MTGPTLCFPHQAQLDPASYVAGLVEGLLRKGLRIAEHTRMTHVDLGPRPCVHTDRGARVRADQVVFASHTPVNDVVTMHTKQWATRTYAVAVTVPKGSVPVGLFWDMEVPYHYVRLVVTPAEHDWLIVGGEDHRTGQPGDRGDRWEQLLSWARARVPDLGVVVARWSGQIIESVDGLAYIGANPGKHRNVFIVSALSGNGMTYGTIAAEVMGALLSGRESPYGAVYDPARTPRRAVRAFLRENLNTAGQYRDWVLPASVSDEADISPGEGGIVRRGLSLLAIYRDNTGELHRCSAVCPHLGGAVRWNAAERSWDCPCHGSRFSPDGQVLNGPATTPLAPHVVASPTKLAAE